MPHDPSGKATGLGYFRVRSPLLTESRFLYFPAVTEMFHFAALAQEFRDQRLFDSYPELIAAFHAYQSRLVPRHPPYALNCLTTSIFGFSRFLIASAIQAYSPWTLALLSERIEIVYCRFHNHRIVKELTSNFRDRILGRPRRRAGMLLAYSLGVNRSARLFRNRSQSVAVRQACIDE